MTDKHTPAAGQRPGLRGRIVPPAPPAPLPESRPSVQEKRKQQRESQHSDHSQLAAEPAQALYEAQQEAATEPVTAAGTSSPVATKEEEQGTTSDSDVVRAGGSMAIATLISRITGFLRNLAIGATLGSAVGSAFTVANTLPNLVTEIVLGAVLTSLVVPVLVRAEKEDPDRGAAFIRRLFTLALTLLIVVTTLAVLTAPLLTRLTIDDEGKVNIIQATSFAYLVLPQILFYGIFSLFMAVLNTKGVFRPGAWAPVWNNVVCLATFALYWMVPGALDPAEQASVTDPHVLLLGVGTTMGVVVQALLLVPPLRKKGIDLRPLWGIDDRLKEFAGMAIAIVIYVAISQLGYIVTTRIASNADARAPLIYQQAWLLLQVPYGVIGVTLLTAIMPRLSRNAAEGDDKAVVRDLTWASKLTFAALIPVIVFFMAFGTNIANALFAYGQFTPAEADILGWTLSFSAFTLIPYALVLLHLRVFYAREEAWTPTFIIAGITTVKILLSAAAPFVATSASRVVILLGAANGFGFVSGAVIGVFLLRRKLGSLRGKEIMTSTLWVIGASLVGAGVGLVLDWLLQLTFFGAASSVVIMLRTAITGTVFLIVTAIVLSRSGLPEVSAFSRQLSRVPVLNRVLRTPQADEEDSANEGLPAATTAELSTQLVTVEPFTASPVPPPMSAGEVRIPRLVPGAAVANGRYRLLQDYGRVPGARFWHARDQRTGQQVALVFVDTQGMQIPAAPVSPATAAQRAAEVTRTTRALAELNHPAIADNIHVLPYRAGCLVVADWVEGTALNSLTVGAQSGAQRQRFTGANPRAVAYAMSSLLDAAATAEETGISLGFDHFDRIRVNTDGRAVLAFPAVLESNDYGQDLRYIAKAVEQLVEDEGAGRELQHLTSQLYDSDTVNPRVMADDLYEFGMGSDHPEHYLEVAADAAPDPTSSPGFGSKGYTRAGLTLVSIATVGLVVLVAASSVYLLGIVGGNRADSPVNSDSISGAPEKVLKATKVKLTRAEEWEPGDPATRPAEWPDNPQLAELVIDGDVSTSWRTDDYRAQFGEREEIKNGVGLKIDFAQPASPAEVEFLADTGGTTVSILGFTTDSDDVDSRDQLSELGRAVLRSGSTVVTLPKLQTGEDPTYYRGMVVWIERLPMPSGSAKSPKPADIQEIRVKGIVDTGKEESAE
ncbi:murein biosynthesis integral membrane protein MurJ [Corynebacterium sp. TAE3-ERU30]|uniref:murein biosynthesis integral membrane protein MurJ n=1 Tax=Corynebacterium sp. TAE3-ERU30 TaxID=2849496 RepID=UPI001C4580E1|nr:murein biosynthesis integral membrane protein MurJ [Corynebacterium sp. TAE3-ERU30]